MKRFLKLLIFLPFISLYSVGCSDNDSSQGKVNRRKVSVKVYGVSRGQLTSYLNVTELPCLLRKPRYDRKSRGPFRRF